MLNALARSRLIRKLIAGDAQRRTRLHDEKGNLVAANEWPCLPAIIARYLRRRLGGTVAIEPWWTTRMTERIEGLLQPQFRVVEFGSGYSTLWLAGRVGQVLSIEHEPDWHAIVAAKATLMGLTTLTLELRPPEHYADCQGLADRSIDFCVVDGQVRARCVRNIWPKLKPGGWLYLDNSDKDMTFAPDGDNLRSAEAFLLDHCAPADIEYHTGFTVNSVNVHQGMLCRVR